MARKAAEARPPGRRPPGGDRRASPPPRAPRARRLPLRERWTGAGLALAAIAAVALAARLLRVAHGLPDFVEEAIPLRRAMIMWEGRETGIDWNPHLFHYPSLSFYLHLALQAVLYAGWRLAGLASNRYDYLLDYLRDPTPMVIASRTLHVLADTVTVVSAGIVGERLRRGAGLVAAALIALSPTMIHTSRSLYTDTLMTCFAVLALERTLAYLDGGGDRRCTTAAALVGLAGGTKYPGLTLLLPLLAVVALRGGRGVPRRLATCVAIVAAVFLATTPFALIDTQTLARDLGFVRQLTAAGHLGNFERAGFAYHLGNLARDLGWPGVALCLGSVALLVRPSPERTRVALVAATLLLFGLPIALARIEAERYLVSVLPWAALLSGMTLVALVGRVPARARVPVATLALAALFVPTGRAGALAAWRDPEGTQVEARRWCDRHLSLDDMVLEELYGPNLPGRVQHMTVTMASAFSRATPAARQRYQAQRVFAAVWLPIATVGQASMPIRARDGTSVMLEIVPRAAALDRVFYDPRLLADVDYAITSSVVRRRFEAEPARYPAQLAFYALLDSTGEVVQRFDPHRGVDGPNIVVYRLGAPARAAVASHGALDPLWWTESVPEAYRREAERLVTGDEALALETRTPDGDVAAWVKTLAPWFDHRLRVFCLSLAVEHAEHRHLATAMPFARAMLEMDPTDVTCAGVLAEAAVALGRTAEVRPILERAIRALESGGGVPDELRDDYRRVLAAEAAKPAAPERRPRPPSP